MRGVFGGLPITSTEFSASLEARTTSVQFSVACTRLLRVQREVIVRARFQLGDLWNQWQSDAFRVERAVWMASLRLRIPNEEERAKYLRPFREAGWVASKWPVSERSDNHCWTYYVDNPKAQRISGRASADCVRFTSRVIRDDGEYMEFLTMGEKPGIGYVPLDLPVRDERTKAVG